MTRSPPTQSAHSDIKEEHGDVEERLGASSSYQSSKPSNKQMFDGGAISDSESEDGSGSEGESKKNLHVVAVFSKGKYSHLAVLELKGTDLMKYFDDELVTTMVLKKRGGTKFNEDSLQRHVPEPYYTQYKNSKSVYLVSSRVQSIEAVDVWMKKLFHTLSKTNNTDLEAKLKKSIVKASL